MPKRSAGLLMYRIRGGELQVFLVHPGGPYWAKKNEGSWTLPRGEYELGEDPLSAAIREFHEETGFSASEPFVEVGSVQQKNGKIVAAWAFEGDCDPIELVSNTCEVEWPPRSKQRIVIPEIDRGAWFSFAEGAMFIRKEQRHCSTDSYNVLPDFDVMPTSLCLRSKTPSFRAVYCLLTSVIRAAACERTG